MSSCEKKKLSEKIHALLIFQFENRAKCLTVIGETFTV